MVVSAVRRRSWGVHLSPDSISGFTTFGSASYGDITGALPVADLLGDSFCSDMVGKVRLIYFGLFSR